MARQPRYHLPYAFYHVMLRGNDKNNIFFSDADYHRFYFLLQEGTERFNYKIHGFCLMNNHVHLILQAGEHSISAGMQNIALRYARYINTKQNRIGHLFQDRYKAIIIHEQPYLLELIRYIHLNPVSATITDSPEHYRWSSHRAYLGRETIPWLTTDWLLHLFNDHPEHARAKFENFILKQKIHNCDQIPKQDKFSNNIDIMNQLLHESRRKSTKTNLYTLQDIIDTACCYLKIPQSDLQLANKVRVNSRARGIIALLVKKSGHLTITEFAKWCLKDASAMSKSALQIEQRSKTDSILYTVLEEITRALEVLDNHKLPNCIPDPKFSLSILQD